MMLDGGHGDMKMQHGDMGHGGHGMMAKERDPRIAGGDGPRPFAPDARTASNVAMVVPSPRYRLDEPGIGLGEDGWRVLTYADLESAEPQVYAA
ncbi:MAG: copper resistance protein CopA, partial [Desulfuromonadales bacterium]|nr:copper resistance protein CopA [Desulfuromonadales bacterium]